MKTRKILIISSIVGLIVINLTIAMQFNKPGQNLGFIFFVQSAFAAGEDCWMCSEWEPCGYLMSEGICPPGSELYYYYYCNAVCTTSYCDIHSQTFCNP